MAVSDEAFDLLKERVINLERNGAVKIATDESVVTRLGKLEASNIWLTRTVLGAIVLALIAFLVRGGLNVPIG